MVPRYAKQTGMALELNSMPIPAPPPSGALLMPSPNPFDIFPDTSPLHPAPAAPRQVADPIANDAAHRQALVRLHFHQAKAQDWARYAKLIGLAPADREYAEAVATEHTRKADLINDAIASGAPFSLAELLA